MDYQKVEVALAHPTLATDIQLAASPNPYVTQNVPLGYDTVLGFFSKTNPEALDLMADPTIDTRRDEHWLLHQASRRDIQITQVDAPAALKEFGIATINAYPLYLLKERLDD